MKKMKMMLLISYIQDEDYDNEEEGDEEDVDDISYIITFSGERWAG